MYIDIGLSLYMTEDGKRGILKGTHYDLDRPPRSSFLTVS
jgi:hypothetical protein